MDLPCLAWFPLTIFFFALPASVSAQTAPATGAPEPLPRLPPLPPERPAPAPASPPAAKAAESNEEGVEVHLTANERGIKFHTWTDEGRYVQVCMTPCSASFLPGKYHFALSQEKGKLVPLDPVMITVPSRIHGTYVSRSGWRTAGLLTFIGSIGAGAAIGFAGTEQTCDSSGFCSQSIPTGVGIAALAVAIVGGITGLAMASRSDKIGIRIAPSSSASLATSSGLEMRIRF